MHGLKQSAVTFELLALQSRDLCYYICDVITSKMIPRGLPYAKRTELKLAMKQSVRNPNTHAITYLHKMNHSSFLVHCIKLKSMLENLLFISEWWHMSQTIEKMAASTND